MHNSTDYITDDSDFWPSKSTLNTFKNVLTDATIKDLTSIHIPLQNIADLAIEKFISGHSFDPVAGDWSCNLRGWLQFIIKKEQLLPNDIFHIFYSMFLLAIDPECEKLK